MKTLALILSVACLSCPDALAESKGAAAVAVPAANQPSATAPQTPQPAASTNTSSTAPATTSKNVTIALPPEKVNAVTIPKFHQPPVIDGNLNDPVWSQGKRNAPQTINTNNKPRTIDTDSMLMITLRLSDSFENSFGR